MVHNVEPQPLPTTGDSRVVDVYVAVVVKQITSTAHDVYWTATHFDSLGGVGVPQPNETLVGEVVQRKPLTISPERASLMHGEKPVPRR